jgi:hypothetical protein
MLNYIAHENKHYVLRLKHFNGKTTILSVFTLGRRGKSKVYLGGKIK